MDAQTKKRKARNPHSNAEDIELIERIRNGDKDAWPSIMKKYEGFVVKLSNKYYAQGGDEDDIRQAARLGIVKAVRDYKPTIGSFAGFVGLCSQREVITASKTASRKKHSFINNGFSLDSPLGSSSSGDKDLILMDIIPASFIHNPLEQVIGNEEADALVRMLRISFSELEINVLGLYLDDLSYEEISEHLGIDQKAVDNALQRVKRKVAQHLKNRNSYSLND